MKDFDDLISEVDIQDIVQILADGYDVNFQNECGETLLMRASSNGNLDAIALLLENGANINLIDMEGDSALMYAASTEQWEVFRYLSLFTDKKIREFCLIGAAIEGNIQAIEILLDTDIDVDTCRQSGVWCENGMTALMLAVREGQFLAAKKLLESGANPNLCDEDTQKTALMFAIENQSLDLVRLLVNAGANLAVQDSYGNTPLMKARKLKNTEIVSFLDKL
jgi:ankyrin repeat protein